MKLPINPQTKAPVMPDKGFRENPSISGLSFEDWVKSKVAWNRIPDNYKLLSWESRKAYYVHPEEVDTDEEIREIILTKPDEVWGLFIDGYPKTIYIKKLSVEGKIQYMIVEMINQEVIKIAKVVDPYKQRIGVPLFIGG